MDPKTIWRIYILTFSYPVKPKVLLERAETQEIDPPFRHGSGLAFRIPFTRQALVIGYWTHRLHEDSALSTAIAGRYLPEGEFDWDKVRYGVQDEDIS